MVHPKFCLVYCLQIPCASSVNFQMNIWSSHLLGNLSNCLMNLKNSGDSTGFEPITCAMPVQCSNQLSYEVTQLRAGQFVGLMFSRERNVVWKKCYMKCSVWNQMNIWSSHLLDNWTSARIICSFDFKHRTSYNISFICQFCFYFFRSWGTGQSNRQRR